MLEKFAPQVNVRNDLAHKPDIYPEVPSGEELLVTVMIEVDGAIRPLVVNALKGTLGRTERPLTDFFKRYENERSETRTVADEWGSHTESTIVGRLGLAEKLATEALHAAQRMAGIEETGLPVSVPQSDQADAPSENRKSA